jgi:hypothetical protein
MSGLYILKGREPVRCRDLIKWGRWMETAERHVAETRHELFRVSTVFLGLDHRFTGKGPPILFETMAFENDNWAAIECERYATWDLAAIGHDIVVKRMLKHVEEIAQLHPF